MLFESYARKLDKLNEKDLQKWLVRWGNFSGASIPQIRTAGDLIKMIHKSNEKNSDEKEIIDFSSMELWLSADRNKSMILRIGIKPIDEPYWKPEFFSYLIDDHGTIRSSSGPKYIPKGKSPDDLDELPKLKWVD
jgi:hypothetical protein